MTFYTDRFMADWVGARAIMFLVLIRPKYKADKGIHAHEYMHVKQWWTWVAVSAMLLTALYSVAYVLAGMGYPDYTDLILPLFGLTIGVFPLLYVTSRSFRLEAEAEAYAAQVEAGADIDDMAYRLCGGTKDPYKLGISFDEAKTTIGVYL
jgi:hypothetical protein